MENENKAIITKEMTEDLIRLNKVVKGQKIYNRNKTKYTCPECGANVWGKPQLVLFCGNGHDAEEMEEE